VTLVEIEDQLPNGFHDSALKGLAVDYERRTVRFHLAISVGDADGPREHRDDCRDAQLELSGMIFLVVDPPDGSTDFGSSGELWIMDGYETRSIPEYAKSIDSKLLDTVGKDAFAHSFFVNDWNSYIHVAARDCAIRWTGDPYPYRGPRQHFYPGEIVGS
jgi:hypothetical protein